MSSRLAFGFLGEPNIHEMIRLATLAEESGYESVWLTETRFTRDALTTCAAVARATKKVRIGQAVINPSTRGAALIAVTCATLDELSRGRIVLGRGRLTLSSRSGRISKQR